LSLQRSTSNTDRDARQPCQPFESSQSSQENFPNEFSVLPSSPEAFPSGKMRVMEMPIVLFRREQDFHRLPSPTRCPAFSAAALRRLHAASHARRVYRDTFYRRQYRIFLSPASLAARMAESARWSVPRDAGGDAAMSSGCSIFPRFYIFRVLRVVDLFPRLFPPEVAARLLSRRRPVLSFSRGCLFFFSRREAEMLPPPQLAEEPTCTTRELN